MIYVAAFLVASAVVLLGWAVVARPEAAAVATRTNLMRGISPVIPVAGPSRRPGAALIGLLTRRGTVTRLQRLIAGAGFPAEWPLSKVVAAKLVLAGVGVALGFLLIADSPSLLMFLLVVGVAVLAYFVPDLLLYNRGIKRQQVIQLELADTLDQMTIAVEAGLGFESAIARAGQNGTGPLAEELTRTLQDIAVGQPRRDAYLALADRTSVQDLSRFVRAVVQADQYGVSIADVLRTQAHEMRLKRRQRAEEKAMQIPVKVIFPLILFILPTLFIVVLGPAAINIIDGFSR